VARGWLMCPSRALKVGARTGSRECSSGPKVEGQQLHTPAGSASAKRPAALFQLVPHSFSEWGYIHAKSQQSAARCQPGQGHTVPYVNRWPLAVAHCMYRQTSLAVAHCVSGQLDQAKRCHQSIHPMQLRPLNEVAAQPSRPTLRTNVDQLVFSAMHSVSPSAVTRHAKAAAGAQPCLPLPPVPASHTRS